MSPAPSLSVGEVAVLRIVSESGDQRWFSPHDVLKQMPSGTPAEYVRRALSSLRRQQLVAVFYRRFDEFFAITTTGETALANHDQERLFA